VKVLVVDDEDDVRRIARLSLAAVGRMDVIEASSASEGIRKAREECPDVVLLDLMMPRVDGLSALRALRSDPETSDIPVVFLTAGARAGDADRLKAIGARGVLIKPFDPMSLPGLLRGLLEAEEDRRGD
jgi:two-component system alkaline phosphatase synthesis response regulator PhoP